MKRKKLKRLIAQIVREEMTRPDSLAASIIKREVLGASHSLTVNRPQTIWPRNLAESAGTLKPTAA